MNKSVFALSLGFLLLGLGACSTNGAEKPSPSPSEPQQELPEALLVLRGYGSDLETELDLTLSIFEDHPGFQVQLLSGNDEYTSDAEILWTGDMSLETIEEVLIFDIPWVEPPGENTKSTITLINSELGLVLQNSGNAMNYFQVLPQDYKYIYFLPIDS